MPVILNFNLHITKYIIAILIGTGSKTHKQEVYGLHWKLDIFRCKHSHLLFIFYLQDYQIRQREPSINIVKWLHIQ